MKHGSIARRTALAVLALCWIAASASAQVVRVYKVAHRTAEELAPLVETAIAGQGRVIADRRTNSLVLSGSEPSVASALALLGELDVRARTVVLRYEARSSGELRSAGASVRWGAGAGGCRVGELSWPSGAAALAIGAEGAAERHASTLAGELRILDGQSGRIASGASLPVTSRRISRSGRGEVVEESTHYVTADSGFEATPHVLHDGRVELALRPFEASLRPGGAIDHASAETRLVLTPGATVALGGILRERAAQHGGFSGAGTGAAVDESLLLVTLELD